jgi:hypothetical protein
MPIMAIFRNTLSRCSDIVQSAAVNQLEMSDTLGKMEVNIGKLKKRTLTKSL